MINRTPDKRKQPDKIAADAGRLGDILRWSMVHQNIIARALPV